MKNQIQWYKWPIMICSVMISSLLGTGCFKHMTDGRVELSEVRSSLTIESSEIEKTLETMPIDETSNMNLDNREEEVYLEIPVYICGAVNTPGVYYVSSQAIINDVIEKCGGFTEDADQTVVNLASKVIANEKIIIPKQGEEIDKLLDSYDNRERVEISLSSGVASSNQESQEINLNTASKEKLMTLDGIGEVKAIAIIAYREENGGFNSIEEIKNISGIGEKTFEKIKQFITT